MLHNIDQQSFTTAIKQSYEMMTDVSSSNLAAQLIESLDTALEEAVKAWIEGAEIPNVVANKYSINKILSIRNNSDYLEAFRLLSGYIKDPAAGEKCIWTPARGRR